MSSEAKYYLPFDTSKHPVRISQGRNGPWSHFVQEFTTPLRPSMIFKTDLLNAVDFALPLGSEVRASREGVIESVYLESDTYYEGLDPEIGNNLARGSTNFIVVFHPDKTRSIYSHLNREEIAKPRQLVIPGDVIAYTGKSGWIAEIPHLHFQVWDRISPLRTLPVIFEDYNGPLDHETLLGENKIWFGEEL